MRIGILALQGAFAEHKIMLESLGATCFEIRQIKDLDSGPPDGLVLPGGESTVMEKLLRDSGLFSPIRGMLEKGLPVLATCAGLILLAREKEDKTPPCSARFLLRSAGMRTGGSWEAFRKWHLFRESGLFP